MKASVAAVVVAVALALAFWFFRGKPAGVAKAEAAVPSAPSGPVKKLPTLRSDHRSKPLTNEEMRLISGFFDDQPGRRVGDFEVLLQDGETAITAGQPLPDGGFLFSSVTPRKATLPDGRPALEYATERFKFTPAGDFQRVYDTSATVPLSNVAVFTHKEGDQMYLLTLHPSIDDASGMIRLRSSEKSQPRKRPPPGGAKPSAQPR